MASAPRKGSGSLFSKDEVLLEVDDPSFNLCSKTIRKKKSMFTLALCKNIKKKKKENKGGGGGRVSRLRKVHHFLQNKVS